MGRLGRFRCLALVCSLTLLAVRVSKEAFAVLAARSTPRAWSLASHPDQERPRGSGSSLASGAAAVILGTVAACKARQQPAIDGRTQRAADISDGSLELFSPAKVNLFLRIIRRRPDGYHDLASLFHTVAFGDKLMLQAPPLYARVASGSPAHLRARSVCKCAGASGGCRSGSSEVQPARGASRLNSHAVHSLYIHAFPDCFQASLLS